MHRILETRCEDSRAETRSAGFGTRRANGSFRLALLHCQHRNLQGSPLKELVAVRRVEPEPGDALDSGTKKNYHY